MAIVKRDAMMLVATGKQRVGKTYQTTKFLEQYILSNPKTGKLGRKVLIFDTNMEYTQYKSLHPNDVAKFTKQSRVEIRRILPKNNDGTPANIDEKIAILKVLLANFGRGLLLLEDINSYLIDASSKEIIGSICTLRHREVDVIIHYQSLSAVPPRMWQNLSLIRFHKQGDSIDRYKDRIPYEILKVAEYMVNQQYITNDIRFFCFVNPAEEYIVGSFKPELLKAACKLYAERNSTEVKSVQKSYKGESNSWELAVKEVTEDLFKRFSTRT